MAVCLVTWDLNKEKPNYAQARQTFVAALDKLTNVKDPNLDSVRFVDTTSSAEEVSAYLRKTQDDNDRLFVVRINKGERAGWMAKAVWEWIQARE